MSKTIVLAEKPSVARELAAVLGCRVRGDGCLIGEKYIVTWALGHLVTLADPEQYDEKYKKYRLNTVTVRSVSEKIRILRIIIITESICRKTAGEFLR